MAYHSDVNGKLHPPIFPLTDLAKQYYFSSVLAQWHSAVMALFWTIGE
jgi:hypothetical protein